MATLPTYNAPAFKSLGSYNAPRWDEEKIDAITQKRAAPGLRELRNQVQRATGRTYGSPQVTKMTLRAALQGYGAGISKVIGESSQAAANEYGKQYGYQITNAQSTYAAEADAAKAYNEYAGDTAKTQFAGAMKGYETESESEQLSKKYDLEGGLLEKKYELEKKYDDWEKKLEKKYALEKKYDDWEKKLEKEYELRDKYDKDNDWEKKLEREYELRDKYDKDNDWLERMDKEYDLWKQRYDYTRSSEPAPAPAPAVPFRWTPLGRA